MSTLIFATLDYIGTLSFAISGAMVGMKKQTDLFGVLFLAVVTAVGGGVTRDVLLGNCPPKVFVDWRCVALSALTGLIMFFLVRKNNATYLDKVELVDRINNIFDALGLGVFSIIGVQVAQQSGQGDNLFFAVFLGLITGIGGGLMRDVLVGEIPFVLKKRIYAVASIVGALTYALLTRTNLHEPISATLCIALVFTIRMLATHYSWNLPRAL